MFIKFFKLTICAVIVFITLTAFVTKRVSARETFNNKFGIHLAQPQDEDIDRAAELVNSKDGAWGYVTLVIQEDDRNIDKWQSIFEKLRERRLIPIIRLATSPDGDNWRRPETSDADSWINFLNSLNWVVKKRYIILFNEPNHAAEWGGEVDPKSFATINEELARKLKDINTDFFVMMAGMDASAPQQKPFYMDERTFLQEVIGEIGIEDFDRYFDGLSSHSYPNPGFVGSPFSSGRGTIRTYEWELSVLSSLGIKELPVFITETGWNGDAVSRSKVAKNFEYAYQNVWLPDDRVIAVTPFVLNYQGEPFLKFSWVTEGNGGEHPEFGVVLGMAKQRGQPDIVEKGSFDLSSLPHDIVEKSTYHIRIKVKNEGQAIWSRDNGYRFVLQNMEASQYLVPSFGQIRPFETKSIDIYFSTLDQLGSFNTRLVLYRGEERVIESGYWDFEVMALPSLLFHIIIYKFEAFKIVVGGVRGVMEDLTKCTKFAKL